MDEDTEVDTNTVTGPGTGTVLCCTEAGRGKPFCAAPRQHGGSTSVLHRGSTGEAFQCRTAEARGKRFSGAPRQEREACRCGSRSAGGKPLKDTGRGGVGSSSTPRCFLLLPPQPCGVRGDLSLPHLPHHGAQAAGRGSAGCGGMPCAPELLSSSCPSLAGLRVPPASLPRPPSGSEHPSGTLPEPG